MIRIKRNKAQISLETRSFRQVQRLNLNPTYLPLKIGMVVGYIVLWMLSASTFMLGILLGAMIRMGGSKFYIFVFYRWI
jgi:hypothetical protein